MKKYLLPILMLTCSVLLGQDNKVEPVLSKTQHKVTINGQLINYTSTTGYMIIPDDKTGKPMGKMFFIYYQKDGADPSNRPLTFSFNGGPGSPSMWLHMGALGPRRIAMTDFGKPTPPPYTVVDNEYSWLDVTDLIFIDPIMTGYSRPVEGVDKKEFLGYVEDIESVGSFIHLATTKFQRWSSPKFIAGESYGTIRASGLSSHLEDKYGMYLNGIVLISAVLNWQTEVLLKGNDLPAITYLPTFCAIAWYHKKADPQYKELKPFIEEVKKFALGEYATALMKGDQLTQAEKQSITDKLHRYTGLSESYIAQTNYRINIGRFVKELLREEGKTVGRLDGRFTGLDYDDAGERYEFDPSNAAIMGPFSMAINDYVRRELKFSEDNPYYTGGHARPWNYSNVQNQFLNVSENLRSAMTQNPHLKVHFCNAYYDLATPFLGTEYTVDHMWLDKSLKGNITMSYYEAGHMMYILKPALIQMKKDVADFYSRALAK